MNLRLFAPGAGLACDIAEAQENNQGVRTKREARFEPVGDVHDVAFTRCHFFPFGRQAKAVRRSGLFGR